MFFSRRAKSTAVHGRCTLAAGGGSALGGNAGQHWLRNQYRTVNRYLNDNERAYLDRLSDLAEMKAKIDVHYACQSTMKYWLLVHLPLAAAVLGLMFWHVIVVNVYAI